MAVTYVRGGVTVSTGASIVVALPPRVLRVRLTGVLFETNKSFMLPGAIPGMRGLVQTYQRFPELRVLVTGHADRAGQAEYNLALSVERAQAVAAFLRDDAEAWLDWYSTAKPAAKRWGTREDQYLLSAVSDDQGPIYSGPIDGADTPALRKSAHRFQEANGLKSDGVIGPKTRRALIARYMATDGTTLPEGTVLAVHGCGEFHPAVATADGAAVAENRRVEVFLFETAIDPPPRARCPSPGCPEYPIWVQRTVETVDFDTDAPEVSLLIVDELGLPAKNMRVQLTFADGRVESVLTDDQGRIRPRVHPGDGLGISPADVHEAALGDSARTASGQHFAAGGTGAR